MKLSQIENFVLVAEELSFSAAAEKSFVSRQALSKSLHELESELDVKLFRFDRNNHMLLTEAGTKLLPDFRKLLDDSEAIRKKARRLNGKRTALRVAYSDILLFFMIPDVINMLRTLQSDSPDLISEITAVSNVDLAAGKSGDYDFLLFVALHGKYPVIPGYSAETLKSFPGGLAIPHSSDLFDKEILTLEDLRGHRVIGPVPEEAVDTELITRHDIQYMPMGSFYSAAYQSITNSDCIIDIVLSSYDKNFVHRELAGFSDYWDAVLFYRDEPGTANIRRIRDLICRKAERI